MAIRHHPRRRLIRGALPGHHVGRDRPGRAAETDQRNFWIELAAHPAQRLIDRFELGKIALRRQRLDLVGRIQRIEPRAFADLEPHRTAERIGDHKDVREDDRGVEMEAADRLQRDLGGVIRREAQIEKAAGLGAQFAIFRQIAAGLPHHPDRRHRLAAAGKHFKKGFGGVNLGQITGSAGVIRGMIGPLIHCEPGWPTGVKTEEKAPPSGDHPLARGRKEAAKESGSSAPQSRPCLPVLRPGDKVEQRSKLKFQTGWGRNLALETRFDHGEGAISPSI